MQYNPELEKKLAVVLEGRFSPPLPLPSDWVNAAATRGMLRKNQLEDGAYYYGRCRNATVAVWDNATQEFTYLRHKFGTKFLETIRHPEDDDGFDIFVPIAKTEVDHDLEQAYSKKKKTAGSN